MRIDYKRKPFVRRGANYPHRYLLNERIEASLIRLIDDRSKQIGVLSKEEALRLAREKGLDLVLISHHANPPVVKLIDFNKFLYQEKKKQQEAKKGSKKSVIKDIKLSLFIGRGDLERLIKKTRAFIEQGHQVRLGLLLKGREMGKKQMGLELVHQFIKSVGDVAVAIQPRLQGRVVIAVIGRKKI